jgi:hypothetical protein
LFAMSAHALQYDALIAPQVDGTIGKIFPE